MKRGRARLFYGAGLLVALSVVAAYSLSLSRADDHSALAIRSSVGARVRPSFVRPAVAYQPRGFRPGLEAAFPSRAHLLDDLHALRALGFRSLVTYGSNGVLASIPESARRIGFDGTIIMGIWNPSSTEEWDNAVAQAPFVDGYCLGNEGLGTRYVPSELAVRMADLRRATSRPVTTSEPIDSYLGGGFRVWLLAHSDWLFPIAHPFLADQTDPDAAVNWIVSRHGYLEASSGTNVVLKEAGFPSTGVRGEERQQAFFIRLAAADVPFFYFEAFDQPWKRDIFGQPEVEAHWGLHLVDGTRKKIAWWLASHASQR